MTTADTNDHLSLGRAVHPGRFALPLFATTLCLSAFLLFSVQPFFTKMLLPRLGGSPGVWSVAMVFFQGMLLLGYAYAHVLSRHFGIRSAVTVHAAVLALALIVLPIAIPAGWETPPDSGQSFWLLGLFASAVGAPFFAVSANGALLQSWFARSGHPHADDPYFLYGSSNIGSFGSLLIYIVAIEPMFSISEQSMMWTVGYGLLTLLILGCAVVAMKGPAKASVAQTAVQADAADTNRWQALKWIGLGFVPSGLLVAVTAHLSLDVAAAPFLWVVPLALFLLTFVIVFRRQPLISPSVLQTITPAFGALTLVAFYAGEGLPVWASIAIHLGFFFVAALHCHSLLFAMRPAANRLTAFYLAMSLGGVLGGAFASIVAPIAFNWVAEYPLLIVAAMLLQPGLSMLSRRQVVHMSLASVATVIVVLAIASMNVIDSERHAPLLAIVIMGLAVASPLARMRSAKAFAVLLATLVPATFLHAYENTDLFRERSFFGISRVEDVADGRYRVMMHGTTIHGAMELRDRAGTVRSGRPEPMTYYHKTGGIAAAIRAAQARHGGAMSHVGAVGLGAGSVACYSKPGEDWTFFEIDQSVVKAASNPRLFRFLSDCGPTIPVVLGDARLTLGNKPSDTYDLLLIDAFSSDSIPVHLMTREAVQLYRSKLRRDGMLVFHISNRYLELESVLAAIAAKEGLAIRAGVFDVKLEGPDGESITSKSRVAVMAASQDLFGDLNQDPRWTVPSAGETGAWTDDFSNIFTALLRRNLAR